MTIRKLGPLLLAVAALAAYHDSFQGVFVYDDRLAILKNPTIRQLWPPWDAFTPPAATPVAARPVVNVTLAINYAVSGFNPWSYHAFNLLVHTLNGLLLFGLLRRTSGDDWLALLASALWLAHPLQTESVMYVTQRSELLFGFFLLLTLYGAIRDWPGLAVAACALGMGSKEVMVVAPLLVMLYDRIFLKRSRPRLYLALAATWLILAAWQLGRPRAASVGFEHLSPVRYALTQCEVIAHYLRLTVWPHPLVIDYQDWPIAHSLAEVWPQAGLLIILLAVTLWALRRQPAAGFLGAWFFLILAPTSSVLPIATEIAAERRMYLPLAAIVVGVVLLGKRLRPLWLVVAVLLTGLTIHRNRQYHSEIAILESTVAARPGNARAQTNLGNAYLRQNETARALTHYATAVQLKPQWAQAHNNLGVALAASGDPDHARAHYREAIRLDPGLLDARVNLGLALVEQGKFAEAIPHLEAALRLQPDLPAVEAALTTAVTHPAAP